MKWREISFRLPVSKIYRHLSSQELRELLECLFKKLGFEEGEYNYDIEVTQFYIFFTLSYLDPSVPEPEIIRGEPEMRDLRGQLIVEFLTLLHKKVRDGED